MHVCVCPSLSVLVAIKYRSCRLFFSTKRKCKAECYHAARVQYVFFCVYNMSLSCCLSANQMSKSKHKQGKMPQVTKNYHKEDQRLDHATKLEASLSLRVRSIGR